MTISNPQVFSTCLAIGIAVSIFWLIRKDYLVQRDGIKWMIIAIAVLIYGFVPKLNDAIGHFFGVSYPPIIAVLVGLGLVLIKSLLADIERARLQMSVTRLIQKVAILESRINDTAKNSSSVE